ncbi:Hypothetical protein P9303_02881 [Prochlorococcus marinus str. MIT 9303]|uniref:Uncharacterized protein n=1 Tax=Prochlorococcus marinus (strain MIT 9303) TaxID=59922 RepID=A2C6C7_PROM3|nr:Hypothetical protein P9303_02821 [Prochlorococcus marinus str. MIT 9303]ABM77041.1 Hypothetical protein P9303_02881 [Prochlorococcus marinus str. MIT 9303]
MPCDSTKNVIAKTANWSFQRSLDGLDKAPKTFNTAANEPMIRAE